MKVAIIQHVIRQDDLNWNLQHVSELMEKQLGADLFVLSETFATGFMSEGTADKAGMQGMMVLNWMQRQASRLNAAIAGSVATRDTTVSCAIGCTLCVPMVSSTITTSATCSVLLVRPKNMWLAIAAWWCIGVGLVSCYRCATTFVSQFSRDRVMITMPSSTLPTGPNLAAMFGRRCSRHVHSRISAM